MMAAARTEIDFTSVYAVLLGWINERLAVTARYPGVAGGVSFTAELVRVVPVFHDGPVVLLQFSADLDPEAMTAFGTASVEGATDRLEFEIEGCKVLTICKSEDWLS